MANKKFTNGEMLSSLRGVCLSLGHCPSLKEYERYREAEILKYADGGFKQLREAATGKRTSPLPHPASIRQRYGSWSKAVEDLMKEFPRDEKKADISFLRELVKRTGRSISRAEYESFRTQEQRLTAPHSSSITRGFNGWPDAVRAASENPHWDKEFLTGLVLELSGELGRAPKITEYESIGHQRKWPSYRQILRHYQDWNEVMRLSEDSLKINHNSIPNVNTIAYLENNCKKDGVSAIKELILTLGFTPSLADYRESLLSHHDWPSIEIVRKDYGDWRNACKLAWYTISPLRPLSEVLYSKKKTPS